MLEYPSISSVVRRGEPCYVWDKADGSNIRAEWSRKRGFYKFGRRTGLLDDSNPILKESIPLIVGSEAFMAKVFKGLGWDRGTAFYEFHGEHSFAGNHVDEPHRVSLFDVADPRGTFMGPRDFLKTFDGKIDTPTFLFHGNVTADILDQVSNSTLQGMSFEGIVAKSNDFKFKWKSQAWLDRLRGYCGDNDALFEQMR